MDDPVVREFTDVEGLRWTARTFRPTLGVATPESHARGWLTFECAQTGWLRRLAPVPADWETCGEDELRAYHASARHVRRRPKSGPLP